MGIYKGRGNTMRKFIKYLIPYWYYVLLVVVLIVLQVQMELKLPEYLTEVVYSASGVSDFNGVAIRKMNVLIPIMLSLATGAVICAVLSGFFASKAGAGMARDVRKKVFNKVQDFSMEEVESFSTGSLITRSTNDVTQIQQVTILGLRFMVMCPAMAITAIIKIINISPKISLVVAGGVLFLLIAIIIVFVLVLPKFSILQKCTDNFNKAGRESLTGVRVIRAFNAQKTQEDKFDKINNEAYKNYVFVDKVMAMTNPLLNFLMESLIIFILFAALFSIKDMGFQNIGQISEFFPYTMNIIMSFMFLAIMFVLIPRGTISAKRISEVLEKKTKIEDKIVTVKPEKTGCIEFKNVFFKYPDGSDYVLEDINFKVSSGETVAFIGSTGSGKTSLINLIPRFYDVSKGSVLVDGHDVRDFSQYDLRDRIGYIPQEAILFSGTITDNIDFEGNEISPEDISKACEIAQASEFIEKNKEKYSYFISQGGKNVSGGQKQRLSIARALVKKTKLYIFDDTFSALDFKTDMKLRHALETETQSATCLIVAQRIGTIRDADQIIVLDEGKIVGKGKHNDLLKNCSIYREIAESQLSKEEIYNA